MQDELLGLAQSQEGHDASMAAELNSDILYRSGETAQVYIRIRVPVIYYGLSKKEVTDAFEVFHTDR
jgi:hypothetical protein